MLFCLGYNSLTCRNGFKIATDCLGVSRIDLDRGAVPATAIASAGTTA